MALGFYFTPSGFTQERYDEAVGKLEAAGAGAPEGRSYHVALESNGEIQVFDIWESQEAFEAFGATLRSDHDRTWRRSGRADGGPGAQCDQGLTGASERVPAEGRSPLPECAAGGGDGWSAGTCGDRIRLGRRRSSRAADTLAGASDEEPRSRQRRSTRPTPTQQHKCRSHLQPRSHPRADRGVTQTWAAPSGPSPRIAHHADVAQLVERRLPKPKPRYADAQQRLDNAGVSRALATPPQATVGRRERAIALCADTQSDPAKNDVVDWALAPATLLALAADDKPETTVCLTSRPHRFRPPATRSDSTIRPACRADGRDCYGCLTRVSPDGRAQRNHYPRSR